MAGVSVPVRVAGREIEPRLPPLFASVARSATDVEDPWFPPGYLRPQRTFDVSAPARSGASAATPHYLAEPGEILALELTDGGTLITSAARLGESFARARRELLGPDGTLLLEALRAKAAAPQRGLPASAGGLISKVYTLVAGAGVQDAILAEANDRIGGKTGLGVTWEGTRALMWAIEKRLDCGPGLHLWGGRRDEAGTFEPVQIANQELPDPERNPMLVFVHGFASSTRGSFGDLRAAGRDLWAALERRFTGGIFGFEHRTLSESPIENAIQLVNSLPIGAHVSLVSHSRGGLIADLITLGDFEGEIARYAYAFEGTGDADPQEIRRIKEELGHGHAEQREGLHRLGRVLRERRLIIERVVRAASPANGTKLATENFDLFLSGVLAVVGQVPALVGSPLPAAFKRAVLELARNRTNPHVVPGIEAMLPDAPLARLLRDAPVRDGVAMAVIAGGIEGGNLLQRLGAFLTDTSTLANERHDLVVDTRAMLAGVAPKVKARVLFDSGAAVSHFHYFTNADTRAALRDWLTTEDPRALAAFRALPTRSEHDAALMRAVSRSNAEPDRSVVVVLPGIMGSHLRRAPDDRVWFDPVDLPLGGLTKLSWGVTCEADGLLGRFYGELCEHLSLSHRVEPFAYDWRQPLDVLAERLGVFLKRLLAATQQPIRLLAHSMGGLVVRACIHRHRSLMDELMRREGARFVMLGTPNQGAYSMVETLLGKGETVRALACLDVTNPLQQVLDIVAGFRGALQLLPKPTFKETFQGEPEGGQTFDFQKAETWTAFQEHTRDFWFGDGKVGTPTQNAIDEGSWLWAVDGPARPALPAAYEPKSIYVFGLAPVTPCGVRDDTSRGGRVRMVGTSRGDGTVTWESGRIGGIGSFYTMPVEHGDLASTRDYFPALTELLSLGKTTQLSTNPPVLRALEQPEPMIYDVGPPALEDAESLERGLMGYSPDDGVPRRPKGRLEVRVKAMDLRFLSQPILVGHYEQDAIAGPEALIDRELLGGDLSQRHGLGLYAGPRGTAVVVLRVPNDLERLRGSLRGAVVTGLGEYSGSLSPSSLTEATRAGALRYLLHVIDVLGKAEREVSLAALLLGFNSSANLSLATSVECVVRGVMEANARFLETTGLPIRIARLDLVELYLDTAIAAVHALRGLASGLSAEAEQQGTALVCHSELSEGEGFRLRLLGSSNESYWPRLLVTDADRGDDLCPPGVPAVPFGGAVRAPNDEGARAPIAERLRFLFVGPRARAESLMQQRQPGVVEKLVRQQIHLNVWQEDLGRALFQLMVPPELKDTARHLDRLVLVLDSYTANLPWELLVGDDPTRPGERRPLALRTAVVRQLTSTRFRRQVRQGVGRTALVIGNPSLDGFASAFPAPEGRPIPVPPSLPGAEAEANAVAGVLSSLGYEVKPVIGEHQTASDVLFALYQRPWRILHVSAHGVFELRHRDGGLRSGVLLSDGLLISAAEIRGLEVVPELVVLSSCHLGAMDIGRKANRLAASIARELIDIGVRCVIVAGWAVSDDCARLFSEVFYRELLLRRRRFGDAVFEARRAVWTARLGDITWGAFQAYGDPSWLAEPRADGAVTGPLVEPCASMHEVVDYLSRLRLDLSRTRDHQTPDENRVQAEGIAAWLQSHCPEGWRRLPRLQAALAATYRDLGDLERARAAFLAAVQDDEGGVVPIRALEQLADVEMRWGEQLARRELAERPAEEAWRPLQGEALIDLALHRLCGLDQVISAPTDLASRAAATPSAARQGSSGPSGGGGVESVGSEPILHRERSRLRGGAWELKAGVYARQLLKAGAGTAQGELGRRLSHALEESVAAYRSAEGDPASARFSPDLALNRLALDALTKWEDQSKRDAAIALARLCYQRAVQAFAEVPSSINALVPAEALLVEHLLDGSLGQIPGQMAFDAVARAYAEATANIAINPAQRDTVSRRLELRSAFCGALALAGGNPALDSPALARIADRLLELRAQIQTQERPRDAAESSRSLRPADS